MPSVREAVVVLGGLDPGPKLIAAGRAAAARFSEVDLRPRRCATRSWGGWRRRPWPTRPGTRRAPAALRLRAVDGVLVMLTFAPALALLGAH